MSIMSTLKPGFLHRAEALQAAKSPADSAPSVRAARGPKQHPPGRQPLACREPKTETRNGGGPCGRVAAVPAARVEAERFRAAPRDSGGRPGRPALPGTLARVVRCAIETGIDRAASILQD